MILLLKLLLGACIAAVVLVAAYYARKTVVDNNLKTAENTVAKKLIDAEESARSILLKAEKEALDLVKESQTMMNDEQRKRREEIESVEARILEKEKAADERDLKLQNKEAELLEQIELSKEKVDLQEQRLIELNEKLETVAGLSRDEAEKMLMANVEKLIKTRAGKMIKEVQDQAKSVADRKAKEIILDAIERTATDHVVAATTARVNLPDDEMKGRIIGKEGRNIRIFESSTGVDVIIDDTPNTVILSAFNPIRRETARIAMDLLVKDGRINPARIEDMIDTAKEQLQKIIMEHGDRVSDELQLEFQPEMKELLGRLYYRTSYGQNILDHSIESARIAGSIAETLGVNINLAKRGALLHDIGKAVDFEQEGSHDDLGAELCRKYGESDELLNCIMAHHEDEVADTVEAVIVKVADAISSVRPGARKESAELYIKRLKSLEKVATEFDGVEKVYAIQAGREVRVMVNPGVVNDDSIHKLVLDIATAIEKEVDYPGEVKVSLVREVRATSIAK